MKAVRSTSTVPSLLQTTRQQRPHLQARIQSLRPTNHNRSFISNALSSEPQFLSASRILPYPEKAIYSVIADISSYSKFVPYCRSSTVTALSEPTEYDGRKYPEEAKLVVGFSNDIAEEFTSRVYCSPALGVVEAISGASETTLENSDVPHHHPRPAAAEDPSRKGDVLSHLSTRWTLRSYPYKPPPAAAVDRDQTHKNHEETSPVPGMEKTEVGLRIEFRFANPMYGALSQAAAPKVAERMIEAFQARVKKVAEGPGH